MIVWLINLYNFMDGIDGIAGGNAVVVALFGGLLAMRAGDLELGVVIMLVAGASMGFLVWNWPPARIFMGDVGSGFLGYLFGVIALVSQRHGPTGAAVWLLLLGVFVFDSTVTLARRVLRREQWYAAHRSHAYQRLVQSGRTHRQVTAAVLLSDCGLGLAALAVALGRAPVLWVVLGAATALTVLYLLVEHLKPMAVSPEPSA
jgi:Fuc2NAc and GlcNAc transferase